MPAERFRDVGFRAMKLASRTTIILSFGACDDDSAEWPISSAREDTRRAEEGLLVELRGHRFVEGGRLAPRVGHVLVLAGRVSGEREHLAGSRRIARDRSASTFSLCLPLIVAIMSACLMSFAFRCIERCADAALRRSRAPLRRSPASPASLRCRRHPLRGKPRRRAQRVPRRAQAERLQMKQMPTRHE